MTLKEANLKKIRIQLKWYPNANVAGILVAKDKGFFEEAGINAEIISGAPGTNVDKLVAYRSADFGMSSLSSVMVNQQRGLPIASIAQIHQRSSQGIVTLRSTGIDAISKLKGKTIGTFGGVNELQLVAFLNKFNLSNKVELVIQESINQLLTEEIDLGALTTYNQLHYLHEKGCKSEHLDILMFSEVGLGMLEDTFIARKQLIDFNPELCVCVVKAILRGWRYTFRHPDETIDIVMRVIRKDSNTRNLQIKMLKTVQSLIMPQGYDLCDIGSYHIPSVKRTADTLLQYDLVENPIQVSQDIDPSIVYLASKKCKSLY